MSTTTSRQANLHDQEPIPSDNPGPALDKPRPGRDRSRHTLNRLVLALVGVVAGAVGQYFLTRESLWDGFLFFGIGVILFVSALVDQLPLPPPVAANDQTFVFQSGWRRNVGIWLIVLALGASLLAYNLFSDANGLLQAWWLYAGSLIFLTGGGLLLSRGDRGASVFRDLFPQNYAVVGLGLILIIALFMRLYHFDSQPTGIWFDEAEAGLQARRMLQEPAYRPVLFAPINITGHLLALYAGALYWLGDDIGSMRFVSVAFGLGTVLAAYLFGRELRDPRFGLTLALLVAVMRWHVNFSRIAMTGIDASFFEFLSLFFLIRWLQKRHFRDVMWTGLTLGFGLMFYTAFRLYVAALILFAVFAVLLRLRRLATTVRWHSSWLYLGHISMLVVAIWLVAMPLAHFAFNNSEAFWYRTRQISIFNRRDQADVNQALWDTTRKHLLMFNFEGDKNGRHNLPGKPMLDPAMAVLWLLGAGLAVVQLATRARGYHPFDLFFILLFFSALAGGVFSVDFEAPQALRSIAVIPAIVYFCALAITALGREAERAFEPLSRWWVRTPAIGLAGFLLISNAATYFIDQSTDFASWNAFSTPETIVGRKMAELGPDHIYLLSPFFTRHPTIRFLAPDIEDQFALLLPDALPIRRPPDRPVALFIHPDDAAVFEESRQLYPNAVFEIANSQARDERPVVYFVDLQPSDIASLQGLTLNYFPTGLAPDENVAPLQTSRAMNVNVTWPQDGPPQDDFMAEWSGILHVDHFGAYKFRLIAPASATLEIDDNLILEGEAEARTEVTLAEGNHSLRLRAEAAAGQVLLLWQPPDEPERLIPQWAFYSRPITNNGLKGLFYDNDNWAGDPVLQRIDPVLDTYFHLIPLQRPYTVEWVGWLDAPQSGLYRLGLQAVQEAQLFVDGQLVVSTIIPNEFIDAALTLEAGLHDIRVRYKDNVDRSRIHLYWTRPNGEFGPIPSQNLWPPLGKPPPSGAAQTMPAAEIKPFDLRWVMTLGQRGGEDGQFFEPRDVAVLSNGNIVVADTANRRVQILDAQGNFIQALTGHDLPFEEPLAVASNDANEIFVLDSTRQWVYRYDRIGRLLDRFGGPEAQLFHPRGLTVLADSGLAVADTGRSRIVFFNPDGSLRGEIGQIGPGPGQFGEPTDVLADSLGSYFVAEADNNRIQRVDASGYPLGLWAIPPTYAFNGPHLTTGPDGSLFTTEVQSQSIFRYTPDGELLNQWREIGPATLVGPVGIYFDLPTNRLYVTDVSTHQVYVFEVVVTQ